MASADGGREEAYAIGLDQGLPARAAALVNGTASHALDYDDTHFASLGHPSVTVIPAALAMADKTGASAQTFLEAALIGMELTVRIGKWLGRSHYRTGFHLTPTAGTFGAAMAASRLLGLSDSQTRHALGLAASRAGGVKAQFGTMGKPYHAGMAASNGVEVALLAAGGLIAAEDGLEGRQGFSATHHGDRDDSAFDGLGGAFLLPDVSHKFHACCHGTHAALEALNDLRNRHDVAPSDIERIGITVHPQYLDICNIASPTTGLEAKFSYRMVAALAVHDYDTARMETFSDAICDNPDLIGVRDRVEVSTDPATNETGATVEFGLRSGQTLMAHHDLLAQRDLTERSERIRTKVRSLLGEDCEASIWRHVANGDQTASQWMQNNAR